MYMPLCRLKLTLQTRPACKSSKGSEHLTQPPDTSSRTPQEEEDSGRPSRSSNQSIKAVETEQNKSKSGDN